MSEALNELIVIPKESALEVFTTEGSIDLYLEQIKAAVTGVVHDLSTDKGRKAVASLAFKVTKSKTYLESVGKELADVQKEIPKKIDATRKRARDYLESLAAEVRKPLTEWEEEQARIAAAKQSVIDSIVAAANLTGEETAEEIQARITQLGNDPLPDSLEERKEEAEAKIAYSLEVLGAAFIKRQKYESEQAELARLRAEKEERDRIERERQIADQAAERARREQQDALDRAERERKAAEDRAEQAERDAQLAASLAADAERKRIADEQRKQEEDARAREADREHRKAINTAALDAFMAEGVAKETAVKVITLIAQRKIPAIAITY